MNHHEPAPVVYRPMKVARPGTVKEVCQSMAREVGGVKRLAALARRKLSSTHACLDPDHPSLPSIGTVVEAVRAGARRPVEFLCAEAGGVFLPLEQRDESLPYVAARLLAEIGDFTGSLMINLGDGKLDEGEKLLRRAEIAEAMRSLATAYAALEPNP